MLKPLTNLNFVKSFIQCRNGTNQNLNTPNWTNVLLTDILDFNIGNGFIVENDAIKCLFDGHIDIYASIRGENSIIARTAHEVRIAKNNISLNAIGSSGYIRENSNHDISSSSIRTLATCKKNDLITVQCHREAADGVVDMVIGSSIFLITRIS